MTDRWEVDVEPYVLGALEADERVAFEEHLRGCPSCRAAVDAAGALPALLDLVPRRLVEDLVAEDPLVAAVPAPPESLPPAGLLASSLAAVRRAEARRRRRVLAGAAAAAAVVAGALLIPASPVALPWGTVQEEVVPAVAMRALVDTPLTAEVRLDPVAWGTRIELICDYPETAGGYDAQAHTYRLVIRTTDGAEEQVATWLAVPGREITVPAATDRDASTITEVELRDDDGTTLLASP